MMSRQVLIGFALASLVTPVLAGDDGPPGPVRVAAAQGQVVITADDGSETALPSRPIPRKTFARTRSVAVLPPARPAGEAAVEATAPVAVSSATPDAVQSSDNPAPIVVAAAILPPIRPSLLPDTADAAPKADADRPSSAFAEAAIAGRHVVSLIPPARPDFAGDDASAQSEGVAAADDPQADAAPRSVVRLLPPERPVFPWDEPLQTGALAEPQPAPAAKSLFGSLFGALPALPSLPSLPSLTGRGSGHNGIDGLITTHAKLNDVPEDLVHRIVIRESKYNPRAIGRGGALGLMQIKDATARGLGYTGTPAGLLDAETNITYAVKYLAGAYRAADGNYDRSVAYYARGYYYASKQRGIAMAAYRGGKRRRVQEADASAPDAAEPAPAIVAAAPAQRSTEIK